MRPVTPPTSWDPVAEWYDDLVTSPDSYQRTLILPNLLRLIAPKAGMHIIDVACGQGLFALAFAEAGAKVTAADISGALVEKAKAHDAANRIEWHVAPAPKLAFAADASFDVATLILAAQNIDDLKATFQEIRRVLKPGGSLHIVLNHPAFRVLKRSTWGWDPRSATQFRRVDGYLTEDRVRIAMHPGSAPDSATISYHRPLQTFIKALGRNGFAVTNMEEWASEKKSDSGPRADAENRSRKEIPLFMELEAKAV
jgi:ubiquinone/menaquinone biosynthesis C-methylase UbiE